MNLIIMLLVGIAIGFVIGAVTAWNESEKLPTARVCRNCNSWQLASSDKGICGHGKARDKQSFLSSSSTCGHFDYTEELKSEQVRHGLEKSFKCGKL